MGHNIEIKKSKEITLWLHLFSVTQFYPNCIFSDVDLLPTMYVVPKKVMFSVVCVILCRGGRGYPGPAHPVWGRVPSPVTPPYPWLGVVQGREEGGEGTQSRWPSPWLGVVQGGREGEGAGTIPRWPYPLPPRWVWYCLVMLIGGCLVIFCFGLTIEDQNYSWCPKLIIAGIFLNFLNFFEDMSPFCGATDTPVLDFWWCLPWVSKPGWIPRLRALSPACQEFLRFTSGATPADCIEV